MLIRYTDPPPPEKRKKCRPKTFRTAFSREPSFPRKWESGSFGFACFKFRVTSTSSFPRKRESRISKASANL
ncbi:hypothetical protein CVB95_10980 [Neisseria gonorrhoeae]